MTEMTWISLCNFLDTLIAFSLTELCLPKGCKFYQEQVQIKDFDIDKCRL